MKIIQFIFSVMLSVGTFATGIAAIIALFKVARNAMYRNEILFGEEAEKRFEAIKKNLNDDNLVGNYKFSGGASTIIPQMKITRSHYNAKTMQEKYKGCTRVVRYITHGTDGKPIEQVWRLK